MRPIETLDLGKRTLRVHGLEVVATLRAQVYIDQDFQLDWDFEPGEKEKLERQLERGDITPCGIVVEAFADGIEGSDSLWAVLVSKPEDITQTIEDHGMVDIACNELVAELIATANRLRRYATVD